MMLCYARRLPNRLRAGLLLMSGLLIADIIAVRNAHAAPDTAQPAGDFRLTVRQGAVSLKAQGTPLNQVFRELGRQAEFEVVSNLSDDETVTLHFDRLPLEAAIKRLAKNAAIIYSRDPDTRAPKIAKVLLLAEGKMESVPSKGGPTSPPAHKAVDPTLLPTRGLEPTADNMLEQVELDFLLSFGNNRLNLAQRSNR